MYKLKIHTAESNPLGLFFCTHKLRKASLHSSDFCRLCSSPFGIWGAQPLLQVLSCLEAPVYSSTIPSCPEAAAVWHNRLVAGHSHFLLVSSKGRRISAAGNTTALTAHGLTGLISAKCFPFTYLQQKPPAKLNPLKKLQQTLPIQREILKLIISYVVNINETPELFKILCSKNWNSVTATLKYITKDEKTVQFLSLTDT